MAQKKYLDYTQLQTFLAKLRCAFSASGHKHTKADITDFPTALKNPSSLTVKTNGTTKATYDGSTALSVDITAANVGAAAASHTHNDVYYTETEMDSKLAAKENTVTKDSVNKFINLLDTDTSTPTDNDYYVSQYVAGGTTTTTFHRRPVRALWSYIKSKADGVYAVKSHMHDDRYYTETEINSKVDTLNASIDSKAAKSHAHSAEDITSGTLSSDRLPSIPVGKLDGVINASNLPSYVDDVLEYQNKTSFPTSGEAGKIYVDKDANLTYRWSGTSYVEISPSLALGETSSTAFAGDKGKTAYDHSQKTGNPHGTKIADITNLQSTLDDKVPSSRTVNGKALSANITLAKGDVGLGNVDNTADANKSVKYATSAGSANTASVANSVAWDNVTGAPTIPNTDSFVLHEAINEYTAPDNKLNVELISGLDEYISNNINYSEATETTLGGVYASVNSSMPSITPLGHVYSQKHEGLIISNINDGAISSNHLVDGAITTAKIVNGAVTKAKLGADVPVIYSSTSEPTSIDGKDGDVWIVYEA